MSDKNRHWVVWGVVCLWVGLGWVSNAWGEALGERSESVESRRTAEADGRPTGAEDDPVGLVDEVVDEVTVWGEGQRPTTVASPTSLLLPEDLTAVNAVTTEDLVKYEPGVIIRRRFIGDANGVIGLRGSNMFQTARTMVFADGIPLHYFLQTRWSGAPRWGLVNADELGFVEVLYGPFSAEYGGNAMGGVVNIETRIPTERRVHFEGVLMEQSFDTLGFDDALGGFKGFLSYGEKLGPWSVYAAATRLDNDGQPQTFRFGANGVPAGGESAVTGSVASTNEYGDPVRYYGNSGPARSLTDQFKLKIGYDFDNGWLALFNTGYEVRDLATDAPNNYLRDATGAPVWSGRVVDQGVAFDVRGRNFSVSEQDRRTLLLGGRVQGPLSNAWHLEASVSVFDILEDETRSSLLNPADPAFTPSGTVRDFDEAGWETAEIKLRNDRLGGNPNLDLVTGYRYEHYTLGVTNYDSDDYANGVASRLNNASGGESQIQALFAQLGWRLGARWNLALGGRLEHWESEDGFYDNRGTLDRHVDRSESRFSPKLSLGFAPNDRWSLRWSSAQAYRFPIVEELFQNERRTNGTSIANADLEPEDGLHHNLAIERRLASGHVRLNLFTETIDDVIFNQTTVVDNRTLSTFLPIDQVVTEGAELVYNRSSLASGRLSLRFNLTYLDSEITENRPNPELEGNTFPRMPEWRSHLLLNYRLGERWDLGGGIRYSSDSFGDLDNRDTASEVFGAHDEYFQVNLRAGYQFDDGIRFQLGIDNLGDEITYVHHPWPGRTAFLEVILDF